MSSSPSLEDEGIIDECNVSNIEHQESIDDTSFDENGILLRYSATVLDNFAPGDKIAATPEAQKSCTVASPGWFLSPSQIPPDTGS